MESLELLINRNYSRPVLEEKCKQEILRFLKEIDSVADRNVLFIKNLTKVAKRIWEEEPQQFNSTLERKLYHFHLEGLQRLQQGTSSISLDRVTSLESHFHNHAGGISSALFRKTGDINWGIAAYEHRKVSGDTILKQNTPEAAYTYSFAGNIAYQLYEKTGNEDWLEKAYDHHKKCGELSTDQNHSSHQHGFAATSAKELYEKTNILSWIEECYQQNILSSEKGIKANSKHASYASAFAGDAAKILWEKTKNKQWLSLGCTAYFKAGEIALTIDGQERDRAAKWFEIAGDIVYNNRHKMRRDNIVQLGIDAYRKIPSYQQNRYIINKLTDLKKYI